MEGDVDGYQGRRRLAWAPVSLGKGAPYDVR